MAKDPYRAEMQDHIDRVFIDYLGGRATQRMVKDQVQETLPAHMAEYLIGKGLDSEVSRYFRTKGKDGLPKAPEVNESGEHAPLSLLTVDELTYLHDKYVARADANATQAEKVRERCLRVHGVDLEQTARAS